MLLSNITATVGGVDVSDSGFLAVLRVADNAPGDFNWLPLFGYPVTGEFDHPVDASSPLVFSYDLSAVDNRRPMHAADMALTNLTQTGFHSLVETMLQFEDGTTRLIRMGWDADSSFLGDRMGIGFSPSTSLSVQTRIYGTAPRGGGGVGFFSTIVPDPGPDPSPVPEPGTIALIGSGLALMVRRLRT